MELMYRKQLKHKYVGVNWLLNNIVICSYFMGLKSIFVKYREINI